MASVSRRCYTDDFKRQAIALAESIGPAQAARQLEMSVKMAGRGAPAQCAHAQTDQ